jgi:hypothetical protein
LRLAPLMDALISPCQSAFIKKWTIHDNFLYVRNLTRMFHRTKTSTLLLKLDISKAFDSDRWDYLISLMERRGFPTWWRNWISALLAFSTSSVLLNGIPLEPILDGRGLRQGDPPPPLYLGHRPPPKDSTAGKRKEIGIQAKQTRNKISSFIVCRWWCYLLKTYTQRCEQPQVYTSMVRRGHGPSDKSTKNKCHTHQLQQYRPWPGANLG